MPGPDDQDERRDVRLHNGLFWGGVGLAPLAALLLLVGQEGGPLRFAAVLAILAVVLIGLSITLRSSSDTVRIDVEETLYEEIDALRNDVREDIGTAARATHKAFGEKLQLLNEQLTVLRAQLDALRAESGGAAQRALPASPYAPSPAPGGLPAAGSARAAVGDARTTGWSAGGDARPAGAAGWSPPGEDRHGGTGSWSAGAGHRPAGGVVRHTETVQVTTRQTIVDPASDDAGRSGTVYGAGGGYGRHGEPEPESWTERQRGGEPRGRYPADDDNAEPDRWSDVRAADRWASVREDDRGREVRVGHRRAAMHADDSGTELRIEDRWAAVRRDDARRAGARSEESWRDEPPRAEWGRDDSPRGERWGGERDGWRGDSEGWRDGREAGSPADWRAAAPSVAADWRETASPASADWRAAEQAGWNGGGDTWRGVQDGWRDDDESGSGRGGATRPAGRSDGYRPEVAWERERRTPPALPAGGVPAAEVWDNDWAEPQRQPAPGRRRRDDDGGYRYAPEPDDRWR